MTLKEKLNVIKGYDEQDPHETFMSIADDFAIEFALFISDNLYEEMYDDGNRDVNSKTWITYNEEGFGNYLTAKTYSILDLLDRFKKQKGL